MKSFILKAFMAILVMAAISTYSAPALAASSQLNPAIAVCENNPTDNFLAEQDICGCVLEDIDVNMQAKLSNDIFQMLSSYNQGGAASLADHVVARVETLNWTEDEMMHIYVVLSKGMTDCGYVEGEE